MNKVTVTKQYEGIGHHGLLCYFERRFLGGEYKILNDSILLFHIPDLYDHY